MTLVITSAAVFDRSTNQSSASRVRDSVSPSRPLEGAALSASSTSGFSTIGSAALNASDPVSVSAARGSSRALRSLSKGASYINTAEDALETIDSLLDRLDTVAAKIESEVDPTRRDSLAEEGSAILSEIDRIAGETEVDDRSVFSGESLYLAADLNGSDSSSASLVSVSVPGLSASRSDLGIDSLDAASLESGPERARDAIDDAQVIVREQLSALESSRAGLSQAVSAYGTRQGLNNAAAITSISEARETAQSVLDELVSGLASSLSNDSLTPSRVKDLLTSSPPEIEDTDPLYPTADSDAEDA